MYTMYTVSQNYYTPSFKRTQFSLKFMDFNEILKYCTLHYLNITYCQEQVYKVKINDADELRQHIQTVCDCDELDQRIITDKAIKQWRTRL